MICHACAFFGSTPFLHICFCSLSTFRHICFCSLSTFSSLSDDFLLFHICFCGLSSSRTIVYFRANYDWISIGNRLSNPNGFKYTRLNIVYNWIELNVVVVIISHCFFDFISRIFDYGHQIFVTKVNVAESLIELMKRRQNFLPAKTIRRKCFCQSSDVSIHANKLTAHIGNIVWGHSSLRAIHVKGISKRRNEIDIQVPESFG